MTDATRILSRDEKLAWLRLIRSENVGPITFFHLLERFGSAQAALDAVPEMSLRGGRRRAVRVCPKSAALAEMERIDAIGARLIAYGEPDYPTLLGHIPDPPPLIIVAGSAGPAGPADGGDRGRAQCIGQRYPLHSQACR